MVSEQGDSRDGIPKPPVVKQLRKAPYATKVACGLYFSLAGIALILQWVFIGFKQTQLMGLVFDIILWGFVIDEGGGWRLILAAKLGLGMLSFWYMDGLALSLRIFLEIYLAAIVIMIFWPGNESSKDGAIQHAA